MFHDPTMLNWKFWNGVFMDEAFDMISGRLVSAIEGAIVLLLFSTAHAGIMDWSA